LAQKLYEGIEINGEETGLITYMRTDSVQVTSEGLQDCRNYIKKSFGASFLPEEPRIYKTKAKNAQEAHEAIRPTDLNRTPQSLSPLLEKQALSVYELIWKRMVASQMASADFDQIAVDIASFLGDIIFRATGSTLLFEGFLKLYRESLDEGEKDELDSSQLPLLSLEEQLSLKEIDPFQHFTQPPPRYSEASLIKKMEELGIGRPSTYARIMQVLRDREYVRLEKRQLLPEERGRLVTAFLTHYFSRYVQYDFTAGLEDQLDGISSGNLDFKKVLEDFWESFYQTIQNSQNLKISDVLETLEKDLSAHLFGTGDRVCPSCHEGQLGLRLGKFGAFLGCSRYPDCNYTKPLDGTSSKEATEGSGDVPEAPASKFPQILGDDPVLGLPVSLRLGPYGIYLQWGEGSKPKRVSLPKGIDLSTLTLKEACLFGALPRDVGMHPEDGLKITAGIGRFGPYFKHGDRFVSVKSLEIVLQGSLEEAVDLIQKKAAQPSRGGKKPIASKKIESSKKVSKGKTSKEKK
jgi:DNA topoisomerase-1